VIETLDLATWHRTGVLVIDGFFPADDLRKVQNWVGELEALPGTGTGILQYDEITPGGGSVRCRTENFVPFHAGMRALLTQGPLLEVASVLLAEQAVLYKEKINYKLPGGAGFAAHQDAPAYPFVRSTITCMIAVDDSTIDNGCLEVVHGMHHDALPTDETGCIPAELAATLGWEAIPVRAGSLLWFNWYVPHRSGPNRSSQRRRAIYLTYNAASDGNFRDKYYQEKKQRLENGSSRISLIGHFNGTARAESQD
jgi:hypothetical protein